MGAAASLPAAAANWDAGAVVARVRGVVILGVAFEGLGGACFRQIHYTRGKKCNY